jgi:hypothetical protein
VEDEVLELIMSLMARYLNMNNFLSYIIRFMIRMRMKMKKEVTS